MTTTVSQEAGVAQADEAMALEAARNALFHAEMARTGVTTPVNGTAPYSWVRFHGQVVTFHDDEWAIQQHRTAGTEKAAAYAQAINDGLFNLAKDAAANAIARHRQQAERGEVVAWMYVSENGKREAFSKEQWAPHIVAEIGASEHPLYALTTRTGGRTMTAEEIAAELWAMAQIIPGEGIEDAINRMTTTIQRAFEEREWKLREAATTQPSGDVVEAVRQAIWDTLRKGMPQQKVPKTRTDVTAIATAAITTYEAVSGVAKMRDALREARSGLCAFTGGPDGACSETIARIDAALGEKP